MAPSEGLYDVSVCHEGLYDASVRHEGLYDVSEETFWVELFDSHCTTERGRREDDGTPDILTNLVSLQASILKKAFPTDGVSWRNLKCNN